MNHRMKAIVFDFDYTLADSSQGVVDCVNFSLDKIGLPAVPAGRIYQTIDLSLATTFHTLTGHIEKSQVEEFTRLFIQRADQVMAAKTVILGTVEPALLALRGRGFKLGIVSTKFRYRITSILQLERLEGFFEVIVGGEDVPVHKPDPTGLLLAAERLDCSPSEVLYVGDSITDAETAQRAGMVFVAVLSGATSREAFGGYPTAAIIGELTELSVLLAD